MLKPSAEILYVNEISELLDYLPMGFLRSDEKMFGSIELLEPACSDRPEHLTNCLSHGRILGRSPSGTA